MPVLAADGCHVTTVEGIGTVKNDNMHPIQKAMTNMHGSQCGTLLLFLSPPFPFLFCRSLFPSSFRYIARGHFFLSFPSLFVCFYLMDIFVFLFFLGLRLLYSRYHCFDLYSVC